ncbi:MAG: HAD family hydrolase [Lachnospiraceae bacterium]|nr:HAD family hydrolase [Lachnospiraceae bacterium]
MDRRIIFLDIDGTLTEPGSNIPPDSALVAVRKAQQQGHYVCLCTGRNYEMLSPLLQYGFDGVIASSGGYIECQGKMIYDCPMTETQRHSVMEILKKNGVYRTIECINGAYTDEGFKDFLREHANEKSNSELLRWREKIEDSLNILPMKTYQNQPIYKIVFMCQNKEQLDEPISVLERDFMFCVQEPDQYGIVNGELINRKFDKGRGVERVCEYFKIPIKRSIAFGDSMNDLEMLETSGFGVCMKNGSEQLKKVADDICQSVTENGLYHAFEKYGLF